MNQILKQLLLEHKKILIEKVFTLMEEALEKDHRLCVFWYEKYDKIFLNQIWLYKNEFSTPLSDSIAILNLHYFKNFAGEKFTKDFLKEVLQYLKNSSDPSIYDAFICCKYKQKISENIHVLDFDGDELLLITPYFNCNNKIKHDQIIRVLLGNPHNDFIFDPLLLANTFCCKDEELTEFLEKFSESSSEKDKEEIKQIFQAYKAYRASKNIKKIADMVKNKMEKIKNKPVRLRL